MARASEGGTHWYDWQGRPCYTIVGKNGNVRNTTLRDARPKGWVPSVTTIIRCAAAPGLERWKQEQMLMAALTLPRNPDEPEGVWLDRVRSDSGEQAKKAADRGTTIHAALQGHFEGQPPHPDYWPHVKGCAEEVKDRCGEQAWIAEKSFAHELGFGGKTDLHCPAWLLDFKTKEFTRANYPSTWDEHAMQLAAYRHGLNVPTAQCGIVFVSTVVPGLTHFVQLDEDALQTGWQMFCGLLAYWCAKNNYRPTRELAAA